MNSENISAFKSYLKEIDEENNKNINLDVSSISQSNILKENAPHYLYKKCFNFPKLNFLENEKLEIICHNCRIQTLIKEVQKELVYHEKENFELFNLNCKDHNNQKRLDYYCHICKKTLCDECYENCLHLAHDIEDFKPKKVLKINKIIKAIKDSSLYKFYEPIHCENNETILTMDNQSDFFSDNKPIILVENENSNSEINVIKKNTHKNFNSKINNISENFDLNLLNDSIESTEKYYFDLFKIVFDDYKNHSNYNHIENILNIEKKFKSINDKRYMNIIQKKNIKKRRKKNFTIIKKISQ